MRVIYASTEVYPALKTGGLADVNAALPRALLDAGADVRLLLPAFPAIERAAVDVHPIIQLKAPIGGAHVRVLRGQLTGVPAYLIEAEQLYARPGNPYVDEGGRDWPDNHLRFALLGWVAACFADGTIDGWRPDIVHGHDWHAGLASGSGPAFGVVSRLTAQKGLDLVLEILPELVGGGGGGQLALLGSGDPALEAGFRAAAARYPGAASVRLAYDEALAHRLIAGSDVMLVPSRFEPCGLTQMYALAYGSLPLVRRVGGLADTVCDAHADNLAAGTATGFVFTEASANGLRDALNRASVLGANPGRGARAPCCDAAGFRLGARGTPLSRAVPGVAAAGIIIASTIRPQSGREAGASGVMAQR